MHFCRHFLSESHAARPAARGLRASACFRTLVLTLAAASLLAGCGTFRSYREEMDAALASTAEGNVRGAIKILEKNNKGDKKDMLFHMELGELRRLEADHPGSFAALAAADAEVRAWEEASRLDPTRTVGQAGSFLFNDRVRTYEGHDYEKIMITTRMAMSHLARGDWDSARVEIKRTHEREAFISELRAAELLKVKQEAAEKGVDPSFKEINGYPVQSIETPEAMALLNSFQNALSHYLAGFVYEALGETGLSAPGYRKAIELKPGQDLLEKSLGGLDDRAAAADDGYCDLLLVIETGTIPGRVSQSFNLPIPIVAYGSFVTMPISFPILPPRAMGYQAPDVLVDRNLTLPTAHVLDLDAMARRALADEMPGIMLRAFVRSASKAAAQYALERQMSENRGRGNENVGLAVALLAIQIGGVVVEQADERGWRTLPGQVAIARARLPRGDHAIDVRTDAGTATFSVQLTGRHALATVRLLRGQSFVAPATSPGGMPPPPAGSQSARAPSSGEREPLYAEVDLINIPSATSTSGRTLQ